MSVRMKKSSIVLVCSGLMILVGCVSAERQAEYAAWQASDDGVRTVQLSEFEAKYQHGWRERAEQKKQERLAREEAARVLALRQAEYERWLASDDKEDGVSLEVFEQKFKNGWEARAEQKKQVRLEREEKARQEAKLQAELAELLRKRNRVLDAIVAADLIAIRKAYKKGDPYRHAYKRSASDWLKEWVSPRLGMSEKDKLAGEALLSEFGNRYLPKAYSNYEKVKEAAVELQQIFNEEFPEPWTIKNTSPKWNSFNKILEKFAKVRTEYFLCHDELCYYWVYHRLGVLTTEDFAKIDSPKIAVKLLPENTGRVEYTIVKRANLDGKDADFALKYAPETYALYQRFEQELKQTEGFVKEVARQRVLLDDVRFNRAFYNVVFKYNDLVREMNALAVDFQTWHIDHRTTEKSSDDVAKSDQERAKGLRSFADSLATYVKERTLGRIIPKSDMVLLPAGSRTTTERVEEEQGHYNRKGKWKSDGMKRVEKTVKHDIKSTLMQRTEVTQMQWMIVMGTNPSEYVIKPDCPVVNVSWNDCQMFIRKLNEMDGTTYRLPKEVEWEYACRAGSTGDWGKRRNGEEGPLDAMGWYQGNCGSGRIHGVALKEPNAWGLFDMHGNVREWCEDLYQGGRSSHVCRGGGHFKSAACCTTSRRDEAYYDSYDLGFRLAASQD